jgi:hypothetical protein
MLTKASLPLEGAGPSALTILRGRSNTRGSCGHRDELLLGQFRHMFLLITLDQHPNDFHQ